MSFATGLLFVLTAIVAVIHCFVRYGRKGRFLDKIPGPVAFPIIGNAPQYIGSPSKSTKSINLIFFVMKNLHSSLKFCFQHISGNLYADTMIIIILLFACGVCNTLFNFTFLVNFFTKLNFYFILQTINFYWENITNQQVLRGRLSIFDRL